MSSGRLAGLRVFVVEDEMLVSLMIEELLEEQRCRVVGPFCSIADALAAVQNHAFDVALLDVNVAGHNIFPVAEAVSLQGIPFLLLSGYGDAAIPPSRPHWRAFTKPFQNDELIATLEDCVARNNLARPLE